MTDIVIDSLNTQFFTQSINIDSTINFVFKNISANGASATAKGFDSPFSLGTKSTSFIADNLNFKNTHMKFSRGGIVSNVSLIVDNPGFVGTSGISLIENDADLVENLTLTINTNSTSFTKAASRFFYYQYGNSDANNLTFNISPSFVTNSNYDIVFNTYDNKVSTVKYVGNGKIMLGSYNNLTSLKRSIFDKFYRYQATVIPSTSFLDIFRLDSSVVSNVIDYSDYSGAYDVYFAATTNYNTLVNHQAKTIAPFTSLGVQNKLKSYLSDSISIRYALIDAQTGGIGNPLRLQGLQQGSGTDSIVTSNAGVLKRLSTSDVVKAGTNTQIATPLTGTTVTIASTTTRLLLQPASTLTTLTIAFPSSPIDGQTIRISVGSPTGITSGVTACPSVTYTNGTIFGITPSTLTGGDTVDFQWDDASSVWRRIIL